MKKYLDLIKQNILYIALSASTLDQWRMARIDHKTKILTEQQELSKANTRISMLESQQARLEQDKEFFKVKSTNYEKEITDLQKKLLELTPRITELETKANAPSIPESYKTELLNAYEQVKLEQLKQLKKINNHLEKVQSDVNSLEKSTESTVVKGQSDLISDGPELPLDGDKPGLPAESSIFSFLKDLKVSYAEFLATLSLEELAILSNLLGLFIIFMSLISITTIMFGEYLIKYFKLESKLPQFSKYILLRSKINKTALVFYFIYIYIVVIIFIIINIYMFFS